MENIEKGYIGKSICNLSDSQAAIKTIDSFQIRSGNAINPGETGRT